MSYSTRVIGLAAVVAASLMLLLAVPAAIAQTTEAGEVENLTVARAKAIALQYMLNNSLRLNLNLSEQLRAQIESLLNVSISELEPQELWDFIRNANMVLAEVCQRVRNAVGRSLEAYAHGLAVAIEARVRNIARYYDMSEDEVKEAVANITQSRDMREMFEALKRVHEMLVERQSHRFANALTEQLKNKTAEAFASGDVRGLQVAYRALDKAQEALGRVLERLKATNASSTAIEAIEKALEHINITKEIIEDLKETLPKPDLEIIRARLNNTLERLIMKAKEEINELLNKVERLLGSLEKLNASELKEELTELKEELNSIIVSLESVDSIKDVCQILDDLAALRLKITVIAKMLSNVLEKLLDKLETWLSRLNDQVKKLNDTILELKGKFGSVRGMMQERVRERVENLLNTATSRLSDAIASKLEEIRDKLKARDFNSALAISTEVEDILIKIYEAVKEAMELLKI